MIIAMHSLTTMHGNCLTEVRSARDLDYGGIEFFVPKVHRYLDYGPGIETPAAACHSAGLSVVCLNALDHCHRLDAVEHSQLLAEWVAAVKATDYDGCWSPEM